MSVWHTSSQKHAENVGPSIGSQLLIPGIPSSTPHCGGPNAEQSKSRGSGWNQHFGRAPGPSWQANGRAASWLASLNFPYGGRYPGIVVPIAFTSPWIPATRVSSRHCPSE